MEQVPSDLAYHRLRVDQPNGLRDPLATFKPVFLLDPCMTFPLYVLLTMPECLEFINNAQDIDSCQSHPS